MSRSYRNHSPGNIRHHNHKGEVYASVKAFNGQDDGANYARYPDNASGCASLAMLVARAYGTKTVSKMMAQYAPAGDSNDPEHYARTILSWAKIPADSLVKDLSPFEFFDLLKAIARFEGWKP